MTASLWIAVQFVMLALVLGFGAAAPESPSQAVLVVLLSALAIAGVSKHAGVAIVRVCGWLRHDPPTVPRVFGAVARLFSGAPGASGTVVVRAPAAAMRAFA